MASKIAKVDWVFLLIRKFNSKYEHLTASAYITFTYTQVTSSF